MCRSQQRNQGRSEVYHDAEVEIEARKLSAGEVGNKRTYYFSEEDCGDLRCSVLGTGQSLLNLIRKLEETKNTDCRRLVEVYAIGERTILPRGVILGIRYILSFKNVNLNISFPVLSKKLKDFFYPNDKGFKFDGSKLTVNEINKLDRDVLELFGCATEAKFVNSNCSELSKLTNLETLKIVKPSGKEKIDISCLEKLSNFVFEPGSAPLAKLPKKINQVTLNLYDSKTLELFSGCDMKKITIVNKGVFRCQNINDIKQAIEGFKKKGVEVKLKDKSSRYQNSIGLLS